MHYRGMIKWTQMAIPEHMEMVKEQRIMRNRPKRHALDQQAWEEIGYIIEEKMHLSEPVTITYWDHHSQLTTEGLITSATHNGHSLKILTPDEQTIMIRISDVVSIEP
ncbi:YolD-like family protein [Bacillus sp. FJAT-45037]|uniref:YolD-like family protein n=1 Tax=Bacillus sp. FJAT-45037 TaxID=2011007 RepID=UPI000C2308D8|nr:YolD-like family protein [Bacillus sp. FJAT-45037]